MNYTYLDKTIIQTLKLKIDLIEKIIKCLIYENTINIQNDRDFLVL